MGLLLLHLGSWSFSPSCLCPGGWSQTPEVLCVPWSSGVCSGSSHLGRRFHCFRFWGVKHLCDKVFVCRWWVLLTANFWYTALPRISFYFDVWGLPWWLSGKEPACNAGDTGLIPWRRNWHPLHQEAWRIPWTEEPGGLQSMGLQRVWHTT